MAVEKRSMCSGGLPLDFFWFSCADGRHVEAAVNALFAAVSSPDRVWNPWARASVRAEFRDRLETAMRGELVPIDQVKTLRFGPDVDMFEIRWQDVAVTDLDDQRHQVFHTVQVRLYYAEPPGIGMCVVGLHAHEKQTDGSDEDISRAQDAEIFEATCRYGDGICNKWGIPELQ